MRAPPGRAASEGGKWRVPEAIVRRPALRSRGRPVRRGRVAPRKHHSPAASERAAASSSRSVKTKTTARSAGDLRESAIRSPSRPAAARGRRARHRGATAMAGRRTRRTVSSKTSAPKRSPSSSAASATTVMASSARSSRWCVPDRRRHQPSAVDHTDDVTVSFDPILVAHRVTQASACPPIERADVIGRRVFADRFEFGAEANGPRARPPARPARLLAAAGSGAGHRRHRADTVTTTGAWGDGEPGRGRGDRCSRSRRRQGSETAPVGDDVSLQ